MRRSARLDPRGCGLRCVRRAPDGLAQRLRTAIEALEEAKAASVANAKDWPIAVDR